MEGETRHRTNLLINMAATARPAHLKWLYSHGSQIGLTNMLVSLIFQFARIDNRNVHPIVLIEWEAAS